MGNVQGQVDATDADDEAEGIGLGSGFGVGLQGGIVLAREGVAGVGEVGETAIELGVAVGRCSRVAVANRAIGGHVGWGKLAEEVAGLEKGKAEKGKD